MHDDSDEEEWDLGFETALALTTKEDSIMDTESTAMESEAAKEESEPSPAPTSPRSKATLNKSELKAIRRNQFVRSLGKKSFNFSRVNNIDVSADFMVRAPKEVFCLSLSYTSIYVCMYACMHHE